MERGRLRKAPGSTLDYATHRSSNRECKLGSMDRGKEGACAGRSGEIFSRVFHVIMVVQQPPVADNVGSRRGRRAVGDLMGWVRCCWRCCRCGRW